MVADYPSPVNEDHQGHCDFPEPDFWPMPRDFLSRSVLSGQVSLVLGVWPTARMEALTVRSVTAPTAITEVSSHGHSCAPFFHQS